MDIKKLTNMVKRAEKAVGKRSPEILTGLGIAGMISSTVYVAVKATPKAIKLIEAEEDKKGELLTKKEVVAVAWKPFVPAALITVASAACIVGAHTVSTRRHAALYSAYKLSETALSEYKDKVEEIVGGEKVKEIKQKIAEDKVKNTIKDNDSTSEHKSTVVVANDGDAWFMDPFSKEPFRSSINKIDAAINRLNKRMFDEMFVSLSDLYDELDLEHTATSDYIGWCIDDGLIESDYSDAVVKNGHAYIVMDFLHRPEFDYDDHSKLYGR